MSFKVVVTPRSFGATSTRPLEILEESGCEVIRNLSGRPLSESELMRLVSSADALLVGIDEVTGAVINSSSRLKIISKYGVGIDNIDLVTAAKKRILVSNTPGVNIDAVADLTVGLMLSVARQISQADCSVKRGEWKKFMGVSLYGKTVGILGAGQVGRAVARRLKGGFAVELLLYDKYESLAFAKEVEARYVRLEEILRIADFISINLPLMTETKGLIGEEELYMMKRETILVNTSRGGIVEERSLVKALQEKRLRGAALDVFTEEPPKNQDLFSLPNLLLTPHIGAYTEEAVTMMGLKAAENVIAALEGRQPENLVAL